MWSKTRNKRIKMIRDVIIRCSDKSRRKSNLLISKCYYYLSLVEEQQPLDKERKRPIRNLYREIVSGVKK